MFDEQSFEWMFVLPEISGPDDPRIDELLASSEAMVESHGGLTVASVLVLGDDAVAASRTAVAELTNCGLPPLRSYPDLVTRSDIAERLEKTPSAVNNWIRGDRQKDFPAPAHLVGSGLWLWHDIMAWVRSGHVTGIPDDEGVHYPTLSDHARVDTDLAHKPARPIHGALSMPRPLVYLSDSTWVGSASTWVDTAEAIMNLIPKSPRPINSGWPADHILESS